MKLIYAGKFSGDVNDLPKREHEKGAVKFKEPDSMKKLAIIANAIGIVISIIALVIFFIRAEDNDTIKVALGCVIAMLLLFPHEFLHAICFKETVYLYTNLKQGLLFVVGTENMSKSRFVFMSMLPNLLFGFVPFILFLIFPNLTTLGMMGAVGIGSGAGDYMNVFNCLTQVPRGGKIYMYGMNSYWFLEEK